MFIDDNHQNAHQNHYDSGVNIYSKGKFWIYFIYAFFIISLIAIIFFIFYKPEKEKNSKIEKIENSGIIGEGKLPADNIGDNNGNNSKYLLDLTQTEKLLFGDFYKKPDKYISSSTYVSYELPINIKIDTANYYEVSRKINLDNYIDFINNNGFAVFEEDFSLKSNNFFDLNRTLMEKEIPVVITSDFLIYYYQNTLKEVFKEIQKDVFYENVWNLNKEMYDIALARYMQRFLEVGFANDPILEAERMELAFFATTLKILMPTEKQIEKDASLKDMDKFNEVEAEKFSFYLPDFLQADVQKEVAFIRDAENEYKSPVFRYPVDYARYQVPSDYKINAKLNNFYKSMRWMNSVFPLYFKTLECEECLLDQEDWLISVIASSFITKDFVENQDLKNQWSTVYKFISFFSGLRNDLTYLHYNNSLIELFGENYKIEEIFAADNPEKENNALSLQNKIANYNFLLMEGAFDRQKKEQRPLLGMRMLQESFWPNEYIFEKLSGKEFLANFDHLFFAQNRKKIKTADNGVYNDEDGRKRRKLYRAKGSGFDLLNLLFSDENVGVNSFEYDYQGYQDQLDLLKKEVSDFNDYTWNNNIYWILMDLSKNLFDYDGVMPIFYNSNYWEEKRTYNTILGSWVNLHLPADIYENYNESGVSNFGFSFYSSDYNYVEPDIELINDIKARNEMILKMLDVLEIDKNNNIANLKLKDINKKFDILENIVEKELQNEIMNEIEVDFLNDFIKAFVVSNNKVDKVLDGESLFIDQSIKGFKLVLMVYEYQNKKIIAIGPIFNYQE